MQLLSALLPDAEIIRDTAREVIQRPEYRLDPPTDADRTLLAWFLELLRWVLKPFIWLFDAMHGMPEWLRWTIVIALAVVLIALLVHIIYTFVTVFRKPRTTPGYDDQAGRRSLDPASLERAADDAMTRGDYIAAVRLLFRACLLRLERFEQRRFRPGMTNREHLLRLRSTGFFEPISLLVRTIDVKWYGGQTCGPEDVQGCRLAHAAVLKMIEESAYAVSP